MITDRILFSENRNVVISTIHGRTHEIDSTGIHADIFLVGVLFMESVMRLDEHADGYTNIEFAGSNVVLTLNTGRDSFEIKRTLGMRRLEKYRQMFRDELGIYLDVLDEVLTKENLFN